MEILWRDGQTVSAVVAVLTQPLEDGGAGRPRDWLARADVQLALQVP